MSMVDVPMNPSSSSYASAQHGPNLSHLSISRDRHASRGSMDQQMDDALRKQKTESMEAVLAESDFKYRRCEVGKEGRVFMRIMFRSTSLWFDGR